MQYKILKAATTEELSRLVNMEIKKGWRPIGGVSVVGRNIGSNFTAGFFQAMVKT